MKKLLEIRIDPSGKVSFESEYRPLKGMNLYQQVFVALLFESNSRAVNRWMEAIRILALADVCASDRPEHCISGAKVRKILLNRNKEVRQFVRLTIFAPKFARRK